MIAEPTTWTVRSSSILTIMAMLKWNANLIEEQEQTCGNCITSDTTSSGFQAKEIDQARSSTSPKQTWKSVYSWKSSRWLCWNQCLVYFTILTCCQPKLALSHIPKHMKVFQLFPPEDEVFLIWSYFPHLTWSSVAACSLTACCVVCCKLITLIVILMWWIITGLVVCC